MRTGRRWLLLTLRRRPGWPLLHAVTLRTDRRVRTVLSLLWSSRVIRILLLIARASDRHGHVGLRGVLSYIVLERLLMTDAAVGHQDVVHLLEVQINVVVMVSV